MSSTFSVPVAALTLLIATTCVHSTAQEAREQKSTLYHHYQLIDIGTLGGPTAYKSVNAPGYQILNNAGVISASADTSIPDPNFPNCFNSDCFVTHATRWQSGVLFDIGALPGVNSSAAGAINASGWSAGQSQNGLIDPSTGVPEFRAVLWRDEQVIDLGTFGGNWSLAATLNNEGQVVGFATNTKTDPYSLCFVPAIIGFCSTQTRAFLWENNKLKDLGTLGGPDAQALSVNDHGQIAGVSYTNATPNPTTHIPTLHPFLWDKRRGMQDLGTLGGAYANSFSPTGEEGALLVNNLGQVIGLSTLSGDQIFHPFLWDRGKLTDLGTLGGDNGTAIWLTDTGEVLGQADITGSQAYHAFRWKNGVMNDLGTIGADPCSRALMANSKGQIVGATLAICNVETTRPFLWENGGPMVDLNTLVLTNSGAVLFEADNINESGEIVASGLPAGCSDRFSCGHIFLLTPCDENHPGVEGCDYSLVETALQKTQPVLSATTSHIPPQVLWMYGNRFRFPESNRFLFRTPQN
jgi:probable HAF family extracellular repeat protein